MTTKVQFKEKWILFATINCWGYFSGAATEIIVG